MTTCKPVKVFCMSDIHADTKANSSYLSNIEPPGKDCFSIFICNGDLCTDIITLQVSFKVLTSIYDEVCFVPGNHELWRRGSEAVNRVKKGTLYYANNSLSKFHEVMCCARQCGVRTGTLCSFFWCMLL